jgi:hypothetical protein
MEEMRRRRPARGRKKTEDRASVAPPTVQVPEKEQRPPAGVRPLSSDP